MVGGEVGEGLVISLGLLVIGEGKDGGSKGLLALLDNCRKTAW